MIERSKFANTGRRAILATDKNTGSVYIDCNSTDLVKLNKEGVSKFTPFNHES